MSDVVAGPSGVFFGELPTIATPAALWGLADLNADAPKPVAQAISPAALAHDGATLYWTDAVTGSDNTQVRKLVSNVTAQVPIAAVPSIVGLAVDTQCVYYGGGAAKGKGAIRVAPK